MSKEILIAKYVQKNKRYDTLKKIQKFMSKHETEEKYKSKTVRKYKIK